MLGWRKRNDGFEWREYVRTTILVRRQQRRDRIGDAARAAVDNLQAAGQRGAAAGAEGVKAAGRGAAHLGQQGAAAGAAGAKAAASGLMHLGQEGAKLGLRYGQEGARLGAAGAKAGAEKVRAALPVAGNLMQRIGASLLYAVAYVSAVLRTLAGLVGDYVGPLLTPIGRVLRQPSVSLALLIAGGVALLGGIIRAFANGLVSDTVIALAVGGGTLAALALAHAAAGLPAWLTAPCTGVSKRLGNASAVVGGMAGKPVTHKAIGIAVVALLVAGAVYIWPSSPGSPATGKGHTREASRPAPASGDLEGRGSALTGDTLRVGSTTVHLNGIEAPLQEQTCTDANGQPWTCGDGARQALGRLLRSGRVTCSVSGGSEGASSGDCRVGERDVAAELVRGGHVFAATGLFAAYRGEEREARAAKAGIWAGDAKRPSDYRDEKWAEAKRAAPDGCPIKGNVRGARRLYVVPWARGYQQAKGERWFCSEADAQAAGFRPAEPS